MNIYSLTCTRDETPNKTTAALLEYFKRCNIESKLLINKGSIFEAYSKGVEDLNADREDIVIFCHDDIEILTDPKVFTQLLKEKVTKEDTGFVGVAGTRTFSQSAVWWDLQLWQQGSHSGFAFHGNDITTMDSSFYGKFGQVVVMDGIFLAASVKTLRHIQLTKPKTFEGEWDFYDIFYTFQTYLKKLKNYTLPIQIRHESRGELTGRDSWHKNRSAFLALFNKHLPATIV
tara:strand:- start:497 stop:1189 length:693 start_codon:yes stop_codon:yes gene_type:complete